MQNVLDTITMLYDRNFWLEIVMLIITGFNDSDEELKDIAEFLVSVSPDIPWHATAFHQHYKMTTPDNTSAPPRLVTTQGCTMCTLGTSPVMSTVRAHLLSAI